jgi:hypothetical protein
MFDRNEILLRALSGKDDMNRLRAMYLSFILQCREEKAEIGKMLSWRRFREVYAK